MMLAERFWSKVEKTETCWVWTAGRTEGYGRFKHGPRMELAHRVAYTDLVGPIPEGLTLDHLCRNRLCVRPDHLEPVTRGENVLRGAGISAENARKASCKNGHPLTADNLMSPPSGGRKCKTCHRDRMAAHRAAKRDRFNDHRYETDDPTKIAVLDAWEHARREA